MKRKSKIERIYEELEQMESLKVLTDEQYLRLRELSKHRDSTVRFCVPKVLCFFPGPQSEDILSILMEDKDELVRVNACGSIGISQSEDVMNRLKVKVEQDSSLVRTFCIFSLADIAMNIGSNKIINETIKYIKELLLRVGEEIQLECYRSLCVLGEIEYYSKLLEIFRSF